MSAFIGVLENRIPERKDFFYQHYFLGGPRIPIVEGVVTKNLKYMNWIEHNYEEVYDIKHDPHETINLLNDSHYVDRISQLKERYKQLKMKYGVPDSVWKRAEKEF